MNKYEKINYLEFPAKDLEATKPILKQFLTGRLSIMERTMLLSLMLELRVVFLNWTCPFRQKTAVF